MYTGYTGLYTTIIHDCREIVNLQCEKKFCIILFCPDSGRVHKTGGEGGDEVSCGSAFSPTTPLPSLTSQLQQAAQRGQDRSAAPWWASPGKEPGVVPLSATSRSPSCRRRRTKGGPPPPPSPSGTRLSTRSCSDPCPGRSPFRCLNVFR